MYVYLLIILSLLISCEEKKTNDFFGKTQRRWISTFSIERVNLNYKKLDLILSPRGTTQAILKINFLDQDFKEVSDCLFYKIPKVNDGEVFVIENPEQVDCMTLIAEKPYASLKSIRNFGLEISKKLRLKVDLYQYDYKLLNLKPKRSKKILSSSQLQAVQVASSVLYNKKEKILIDGDICFDIDDECKEVMSDQCHLCEGSFFLVIAKSCEKKYQKRCGDNICGSRNMPACIRGFKTSGVRAENYCINDSPVGFCQKGLRVVCVDHLLVCQ
jgi:hypothetical protein